MRQGLCVVVIVVLQWWTGCRNSSGPAPAGVHPPAVVSSPASLDPILVTIPPVEWAAPAATTLEFAEPIEVDRMIVIEGSVSAAEPLSRFVLVRCFSPRTDRLDVTAQEGIAIVAVKDGERVGSYRVEVPAPKAPLGRHWIEVRLNAPDRPPTEPGASVLIAKGEFMVVPRDADPAE